MLENKVAIVTGGSSGIGEAIVRLFAKNKARVVIASINCAKTSQLVNDRTVFIQTDVREEEQVKRTVTETIKKFGRIDIVVNNAGINFQHQDDIVNFPLQDYRNIIDTNLTGTFLFMKHSLPHLLETKGAIINIASQLGLVPEPYFAVYCASKAAVIMFTKAVAVKYAEEGLRINCVCPGPTDTSFLRKPFPVEKIPMRRLGTPEEVAKVVLFLASGESSYVTGGIYTVDGGSSLARPRR